MNWKTVKAVFTIDLSIEQTTFRINRAVLNHEHSVQNHDVIARNVTPERVRTPRRCND